MPDAPKVDDTAAQLARLARRVEQLETELRRLRKRFDRHHVGRTDAIVTRIRNHR